MKATCPHCGYEEEVSEEYVGETAICDSCGKEFVVCAIEVPSSAFDAQDNAIIRCPHCNSENSILRDYVGRNVRCCECNGKFHIVCTKTISPQMDDEQACSSEEGNPRHEGEEILSEMHKRRFSKLTDSIKTNWKQIGSRLIKAATVKSVEFVPKDGNAEFPCPWCGDTKEFKVVSAEQLVTCTKCGGKTIAKAVSKEVREVEVEPNDGYGEFFCPWCGDHKKVPVICYNQLIRCVKCGGRVKVKAADKRERVCHKYGNKVDGNVDTEVADKTKNKCTGTIPDHLVGAILATVFCCMPLGIVAIVYASRVQTSLANGNVDEARLASRMAEFWINVSAGICVALLIFGWALLIILRIASS